MVVASSTSRARATHPPGATATSVARARPMGTGAPKPPPGGRTTTLLSDTIAAVPSAATSSRGHGPKPVSRRHGPPAALSSTVSSPREATARSPARVMQSASLGGGSSGTKTSARALPEITTAAVTTPSSSRRIAPNVERSETMRRMAEIAVTLGDSGSAYVALVVGDPPEVRDSVELGALDEADTIPSLDGIVIDFDHYGRIVGLRITDSADSILAPSLLEGAEPA